MVILLGLNPCLFNITNNLCPCVFPFPSMLHSRVLGEQTQLKEEMETLRRDNAQLVREHNHLKQNCEELKRLHSQDQKELADLRLQQQQVQCPHNHIQTHTQCRNTFRDLLIWHRC